MKSPVNRPDVTGWTRTGGAWWSGGHWSRHPGRPRDSTTSGLNDDQTVLPSRASLSFDDGRVRRLGVMRKPEELGEYERGGAV